MDHQAIKDLLPLAALDRLEPDETRTLDEHLRTGCDECEAELRGLREAAAAFALSHEEPVASASSEERIWARLEARLRPSAQPRPATRERDPALRPSARGRAGAWRAAA